MRLALAGLPIALSVLALAGVPALATLPPPFVPRNYYGPMRMCAGPFAADIREGEGYSDWGNGHSILGQWGALGFETWIYDGEQFRDIVTPLGSVEVAGLGTLERVSLASRNAPGSRIAYLYDTADRSRSPKRVISSNRFDGSSSDLEILARLSAGPTAAAMCADVPAELRPTPERQVSEFAWSNPTRFPGPRTVCAGNVALDIRDGERVRFPWSDILHGFTVESGEFDVAVGGYLLYSDSVPAFQPGPLADDPTIVVQDRRGFGGQRDATRNEPTRGVTLFNGDRSFGEPFAWASFSFAGAGSDEAVGEFVHRLRIRRAEDQCLTADDL